MPRVSSEPHLSTHPSDIVVTGVIGVAVTGVMLNTSSGTIESNGWFQAFATCALQCMVGSAVFVLFAQGNRLFGGDTDS